MAFLDNSGDIILDAVLTDAGRQRMARGNGSFKIVKFALGDEEVNYSLFNGSHEKGSAFYDISIMQTPLLEAFTNNTSTMRSKLVTMSRNNILYLPILRINDKRQNNCSPNPSLGGFYLTADTKTSTCDNASGLSQPGLGWLRGDINPDRNNEGATTHISIDQGMDTGGDPPIAGFAIPGSLVETAFMIRVDHRLLRLEGLTSDQPNGGQNRVELVESFVDDDAVASYYIAASGPGGSPIKGHRSGRERSQLSQETANEDAVAREMFDGPVGNYLQIIPKTSMHIKQSNSLFNELGSSGTNLSFRGKTIATYKYIDTIINVTGVTTGYSIDVSVRIIKGLSFS